MKLVHYVSKDGKNYAVNFGQHSEYVVILDQEEPEDELIDGFQVDSISELETESSMLPTDRPLTP